MENTSQEALEIALNICISPQRKEIVPKIKEFMDIISWSCPWGYSDWFSQLVIDTLVKLEGIDAFDTLMRRIHWHHRKWDCGDGVDDRIVNAVVSMGNDVIPRLDSYLFQDWEPWDINQGTVEILRRLGENLTNHYSICSIEYDLDYRQIGPIMLLILETDRLRAVEELMCYRFKGHDIYERDESFLIEQIEKMDLHPSPEEMVHCLEHPNLIIARGAAKYAHKYESVEIESSAFRVVQSKSRNPEAVLLLLESSNHVHIPVFIDWIAEQLTEEGFLADQFQNPRLFWPVIEAVHGVVKLVMNLGESGLDHVGTSLSAEDWRIRAAATMLILSISQDNQGRNLLLKLGLKSFVEGFVYQFESIFKLPFGEDHFHSYPGEPVVVYQHTSRFIVDVAKLNHPIIDRPLETEDYNQLQKQHSK